jgi:hypothetical protein
MRSRRLGILMAIFALLVPCRNERPADAATVLGFPNGLSGWTVAESGLTNPEPNIVTVSSTGRERSFTDQIFAEFHGFGAVDFKEGHRHPPGIGTAHQVRAIPLEMAAPAVLARVE